MIHARKDYMHIQDQTGKVAEDEPVFLLRAKDALAPEVVDFWAWRLEENGGDQVAIDAAREHANKMKEWQKQNESKLPDTPPDVLNK